MAERHGGAIGRVLDTDQARHLAQRRRILHLPGGAFQSDAKAQPDHSSRRIVS